MRRYLSFVLLLLAGMATVRSPGAAAPQAEIVVDSFADATVDDGNCTLREALEAANANTVVDACAAGTPVGQDTVTFSADGTFFLSAELVVGGGVTIRGNGQDKTILDGQMATRVMRLDSRGRGDIVLEDLTIRNGRATGDPGGGISGQDHAHSLHLDSVNVEGNVGEDGGGLSINVEQTIDVVIRNSRFADNESAEEGAAILVENNTCSPCEGHLVVENSLLQDNMTYISGGAIFAYGFTVTIDRSTFSGNRAFYDGGAIVSYSGLALTNSTISNNLAGEMGGGIAHSGESLMEVRNSTIVGNDPENVHLRSYDYQSVTAVFLDSLIANYGGDNCLFSAFPEEAPLPDINSLGYNLTDSDDCHFYEDTDFVTAPHVMQRSLGPLQDNGGTTPTHALHAGSPAIDAGSCSGGAVTEDQRGVARPQGDACDIGAFEFDGSEHWLYLPAISR